MAMLAAQDSRAQTATPSQPNIIFIISHQFRLGIVQFVLVTEFVPLLHCCFDGHAFGHYFALGEVLQALLQVLDFGLRFRPATGLQRPFGLVGELLALEYAGCPLPDELNMQRAAAPGVVAVGAVANIPVVTPPNGECHEVSSPAEYWVLGEPHGKLGQS